MKHFLFIFFVVICCLGNHSAYTQIQGSYPQEGVKLTLIQVGVENKHDTLETVMTKNGHFTFSHRPQEAGLYYLHFHDIDWSLPLLLEKNKTDISIPDLKCIQIKGGTLQKQLNKWKRENKELQNLYVEFEKQLKVEQDVKNKQILEEKLDNLRIEIDKLENRYISANKDNLVGVFLIWQKGRMDFLTLETKYKLLGEEMQESVFGQEIYQMIVKNWYMKPGVVVPDFTLQDTSGQPRHLSDFKAKVKLLDFWASWCVPCRIANKKLIKFYEKYKSQGLEIISISVDVKAEQWKKAIVEDGLVWPQLSDLKLKQGSLYYKYKLNGVPTWILLDKDNRCIALGHVDDDLESLIQKEVNFK